MTMGSNFAFFLSVAILAFSVPSLVGVHLSKSELQRAVRSTSMNTELRFRRQLIIDPQPFIPPLTNRVLQVPIPTNIGFFPGGSVQLDQCDRDETLMEDGTCQNLLTNGNCNPEEEVLLDPETRKGFCARRLCPPDRVFLAATQLCHDPREIGVCPPGRELYYSAYGTAVCTCPDGTVENDDDLDDDVCEPILEKSLQCPPGQVFWFRDFNSPPQCLPDPCNGANLKRGPDELPFVPNDYGKCFQIGQSYGACTYGKIYILNLETLRGECSSLEDAGYNIYDTKTLDSLKKMFGPTITENNAAPIMQQMASYGNSSQTMTDMYGITKTVNAMYPESNFIDPSVNQNTIEPISSYQTYNNQGTQPTTASNIQTNSIASSLNGFSRPFAQTNAIGQTSNLGQGAQPNRQTHHHIVIGPNGVTSTKKTQPLNAIKLQPISSFGQQGPSNQINRVNTGVQIAQQNNQVQVSQLPNQISSIAPNIQNLFIQQSTQIPFNQQSFQRPLNQHNTPRPFIQQNTKLPIIQQAVQIPINQVNTPKPFQHQTAVSQINNFVTNNLPNVNDLFVDSNQGNQRIQSSSRPFVGATSPNIINNIQSSSSISPQGGNQGKEICTFIQKPGAPGGGHKVCQFVNSGLGQVNSLEMLGQGAFNSPEILHGQPSAASLEIINGGPLDSYGFRFGRSLGFKHPPQAGLLTHHLTLLSTGEVITHLRPLVRRRREIKEQRTKDTLTDNSLFRKEFISSNKVLSRRKRAVLPHASPSNVFETRLLSCRPGASRDVNGKCRSKVLPARLPKRRGTRAAPPVPPTPACPTGMAFNIRRMCVPATSAQNSLIAFNLG